MPMLTRRKRKANANAGLAQEQQRQPQELQQQPRQRQRQQQRLENSQLSPFSIDSLPPLPSSNQTVAQIPESGAGGSSSSAPSVSPPVCLPVSGCKHPQGSHCPSVCRRDKTPPPNNLCTNQPIEWNNRAVDELKWCNLKKALENILKAVDAVNKFGFDNRSRHRRQFPHGPKVLPPLVRKRSIPARMSQADIAAAGKCSGPTFQYNWTDCSSVLDQMRRIRSYGMRVGWRKPGPLIENFSTELLCLRMVRIIAKRVPPCASQQHRKPKKEGEEGEELSFCDCAEYAWVIYYNAGIIFQLVAEQLGDTGSGPQLLERASDLLLSARMQVEAQYLPLVNSEMYSLLGINGGHMTQWHMVVLQLMNNRSCCAFEQAKLLQASAEARLTRSALNSSPERSYYAVLFVDEDLDMWQSTSRMSDKDDEICQQLLMNVQILSELRFASAA